MTPAAPYPVDALFAALNAAPDDAARAMLLASATPELRAKLTNRLRYLRLHSETDATCAAEAAAHAEFSRQLDGCADDAARAALIQGAHRDPKRGVAWVSEWRWRRTATPDDWRVRYLRMIGVDDAQRAPA